MVTMKGISGVPEPKPDRASNVRERREKDVAKTGKTQDDVLISSEAQAAAKLARLTQIARQEADIRADRVAQARENIERGDYKRPEVVAKVAERISKYLP